jgi:hypothetical protein
MSLDERIRFKLGWLRPGQPNAGGRELRRNAGDIENIGRYRRGVLRDGEEPFDKRLVGLVRRAKIFEQNGADRIDWSGSRGGHRRLAHDVPLAIMGDAESLGVEVEPVAGGIGTRVGYSDDNVTIHWDAGGINANDSVSGRLQDGRSEIDQGTKDAHSAVGIGLGIHLVTTGGLSITSRAASGNLTFYHVPHRAILHRRQTMIFTRDFMCVALITRFSC